MEGMRMFFASRFEKLETTDYREGCVFGDMTSQLSVSDDHLRSDLRYVSGYMIDFVKRCLVNSLNFSDRRAADYALFIVP